MKDQLPICVVVTDQAEARVYLMRAGTSLRLIGKYQNPGAHLHDRDLKSDRPGRIFSSARSTTGRRGAVVHHATGGESKPRRQLATVFARRIAAELKAAKMTEPFDRLVLVAEPRFLGTLRRALPVAQRSQVVAEIAKDLMHLPAAKLRARLRTGLVTK